MKPPFGLHDKTPFRVEPIGTDRFYNRYWHFNLNLHPQCVLMRGLLLVEVSEQGSTLWNKHKSGSWLQFSSRQEVDLLLSRLNKNDRNEEKLLSQLSSRYLSIVSAMRTSGTEFATLNTELCGHRFASITLNPQQKTANQIHLTSSPVIFSGAPFVRDLSGTSSDEDSLRIGDVILQVTINNQTQALVDLATSTAAAKLSTALAGTHPVKLLVFRPQAEAFMQAQSFACVAQMMPHSVLSPLTTCPNLEEVFFTLLGGLEQELWNLGSADPRVISVMKEWRWLHGWGDWQWPTRREKWQKLIQEKSTPSMSRIELAAASLKTICRSYVSTMPPVHPDCYSEGRYRLDYTYETLLEEASQDTSSLSGLKLSQALVGLPLEGDWLRALEKAKTYSTLSLLAIWLHIESAARFSSAIYTANRNQSRVLEFQRSKPTVEENMRKQRLEDIELWLELFDYQSQLRKPLLKESSDKRAVEKTLNRIVATVAGEPIEEEGM